MEGNGRIDAVDFFGQFFISFDQRSVPEAGGIPPHPIGVIPVGGSVDLGTQVLETVVLFGQRGRQPAYLLDRGGILAVRQQARTNAQ